MKSAIAIITPSVIKWARQTAHLSIEAAAEKINVSVERLQSWEESGSDYPTMNQAQKMAEVYRRSLAVFYLPSPPRDFTTLRDFRRKHAGEEYSTALVFILREIQERQVWLKDLMIEEGEKKLDFVGKYSEKSPIKEVAEDIRKYFNVNPRIPQDLKQWTASIESKRIFVSITSNIHSHLPLEVDEVRGFVISDSYAPFIFVNNADSKAAQLFTLIHELVHVWIDRSGVSNTQLINFRNKNEFSNQDPVEIFCNQVAAEVLMPESFIRSIEKSYFNSVTSLDQTARKLNVSSLAFAIRLNNLALLSKTNLQEFVKISRARYEQSLESKVEDKSSGGDWYRNKIKHNGKTFTHIVYNFFNAGRISSLEASQLLGIKINNFPKLAKYI